MEFVSIWFFISSGLFVGWSLGANHAVNVFGTAVVSRMVKFKNAAIIGGIFVILGSVIGGEGTTKTLQNLGAINAISGSFCVALSVGLSVTYMTKLKLPVSTSQAVIGAIIGWNVFTGSPTDFTILTKILLSWVTSPIIAGILGFLLFKIVKYLLKKWKIHLLRIDGYTRTGLIIVGALASYSLGANNIANVMGMFISAPLFSDTNFLGFISLTGTQILFLLGGIAIAVGIFTYGKNVMATVGKDLVKISPITGFVVVLAEFLVLFLFTSQELESFLLNLGLPTIPLVPLSTTQAFIGAVIGVGLAKDPASIDFKVFGRISFGWLIAPLSAGIITFISLFFMQNVFEQKVINTVSYEISESVVYKIKKEGIDTEKLFEIINIRFDNNKEFRNKLLKLYNFNNDEIFTIFNYALIDTFSIDSNKINENFDKTEFVSEQLDTIKKLHGKSFNHKIDFQNAVFNNKYWENNGNKLHDKQIEKNKIKIENLFRIKQLD